MNAQFKKSVKSNVCDRSRKRYYLLTEGFPFESYYTKL